MALMDLIRKYSVSGPRYTSYPTAPQWSETQSKDAYRRQLQSGVVGTNEPLALYVHIPFCETLCYYCGCNIHITKDHSRSVSYVDSLLREASEVAKLLGERRALSQISWGGGTPTFLNPDELQKLYLGLRKLFEVETDAEVSLEVDPRVTTDEQLECLRGLGFNRVSMGVQDFNPEVQQAVNRIQPAEMTARMLERARGLGYRGINFDLIYGLPHQTLDTFTRTIEQVVTIRPDRIALYNYARLPSMLKHQVILEKFPMPSADERVEIFSMAFDRLTAAGYHAIGMDHFALADDEMFKAVRNGTLYRNFMGYTVKRGRHMVGLGCSAIGEIGPSYFQNLRGPKEYQLTVEKEGLAAFRGCLLSEDDRRRKWAIEEVMCRFTLDFAAFEREFGEPFDRYFSTELPRLDAFVPDGILGKTSDRYTVTELGRLFVRNVAMVFDAYLKQAKVTFSKTV